MSGEFVKLSEAKNPPAASKYWLIELENASRAEEKYRKEALRLLKKYKNEESEKIPFNIFWSNVETLKPAVYSRRPAPDIRQRKQIKDPLGKVAAMILEAGVRFCTDSTAGYDFDAEKEFMRDEMLITGRGVTRLQYEVEKATITNPVTGQPEEVLAKQKLLELAVDYQDYRQSPAKNWRSVRWVAFRHKPTRDELIQQFGEVGEVIPLNYCVIAEGIGDKETTENDVFRRAVVWEIWDKQARERVWVAEGHDTILQTDPDPYRLEDFFPLSMPLYGFKAPGDMVPTPEYAIYEEQAVILNLTSAKIEEITNALEAKGIYPAALSEVKKLADSDNGKLIPVEVALGVDLSTAIVWWPVDKIAVVLETLNRARNEAIQVIYQITGLSDVMRGATDPNETAAAQKLKGSFGNLRMNPRTAPMQRHIRDSYKLMAEIIAEHFTKENLEAITGQPIPDEVIRVLRDDKLRNISVDIETESTVQPDADSDKQQRIEFITAVTGFVKEIAPLVAGGAIPPDVAKSMLSFGVRGFKAGRELEDAIDQIGQQPQQAQEPRPDPEMAKVQAEAQFKQAELQANMQMEQVKAQAESHRSAKELELQRIKNEMELMLEKQKAEIQMQGQIEIEKYKAEVDAEIRLAIAKIQAGADLRASEMNIQKTSEE